MTADKDGGSSADKSAREGPAFRVGNPFDAERTGKCGFKTKCRGDGIIRKGESALIVSNRETEARVIVHTDCARHDKRLLPLMKELSIDDILGE